MRDKRKRTIIKKQQVLVVGGGNTFPDHNSFINSLRDTPVNLDRLRYHKSWKSSLQQELGPSFDVLIPQMPNTANASFSEWSIYFNKVKRLLDQDVILVGHSLGGIFLAKYLADDTLRSDFLFLYKAVILIAAPYSDESEESLGDFKLIVPILENAHLFHSTDDPVVPYSEMAKYRKVLPNSTLYIFNDRQHFNQETFPELVELIRKL